MKDSETKSPRTVTEENESHGWIWRWSHAKVILPLVFIGSVLVAISRNMQPVGDGISPFLVFILNFFCLLLAWFCVLIPAILARLFCPNKLHGALGFVLAIAGFLVMVMVLYALFGDGLRGGLLLILFVGSAYKVACSHFGLSSIGIPISFRRCLPHDAAAEIQSVEKAAETPALAKGETMDVSTVERPLSDNQQEIVDCAPAIAPSHLSVEKNDNRISLCSGVLCSIVYIVAMALLIVYCGLRGWSRWDGDTQVVTWGIPVLCVIFPWFCGVFMRDAVTKAVRYYKEDNPGKTISYVVIAIAVWGGWFAALWGIASLSESDWDSDVEEIGWILLLLLQIVSFVVVPRLKRIGTSPLTHHVVFRMLWSSILFIVCTLLCVVGLSENIRCAERLKNLERERGKTTFSYNVATKVAQKARDRYAAYLEEEKQQQELIQKFLEKEEEINKQLEIKHAFWKAVQDSDLKTAEQLVEQGVNVNEPMLIKFAERELKLLPLHAAIICGSPEMASLLLKNGADVNIGTPDCSNVLYALAYCEYEYRVKDLFLLLLDNGMNPDMCIEETLPEQFASDAIDKTLANTASTFGVTQNTAKEFFANASTIKEKAIEKAPKKMKLSALHVAANSGWGDVVQELIKKGAQEKDFSFGTPFYQACQMGHCEVAQILLDNGSDINYQSKLGGWTPLIRSINNKHFDVARMLIERGADVNAKTIHGNNAVWFAVMRKSPEILVKLLAAGAHVNDSEGAQASALVMSTGVDSFECAQILVRHGADFERTDKNGITDAMILVAKGQHDKRWLELMPPDVRNRAILKITQMQRRGARRRY